MSLADGLIDAAQVLHEHGTPAARRRSVSTSYYAAFHAVGSVTTLLINEPFSADAARRSITHTRLATVAGWASDLTKAGHEKGSQQRTNDLQKLKIFEAPTDQFTVLGTSIADLHRLRELADYQTVEEVSGEMSQSCLTAAENVVAAVASLTSPTLHPQLERLVSAALFKSRDE